jgi:hypothetical protein
VDFWEIGPMSAETRTQLFSPQVLRQVRLDCSRALVRGRYCAERSEITQLRCIDNGPELDDAFGNQLWYFEGVGVDVNDRRRSVYGVVEYSIQFGLLELVEDGVFESSSERERFRYDYERELHRPSWRQPAHRWLAAGLVAVTALWLSFLLLKTLAA